MSKEIQSIIIEEIEREPDLYKKVELITIALASQIEQNQKLERVVERLTQTLTEAGNFTIQSLRFMEITSNKFKEIDMGLSRLQSGVRGTPHNDEITILKKNISLLQENLQEVYELIMNMK